MQLSTNSTAFVSAPLSKLTPRRERVSIPLIEPSIRQWNLRTKPNNRINTRSIPLYNIKASQSKTNHDKKQSSKPNRMKTIFLAFLATAATTFPLYRMKTKNAIAANNTTTTVAKATPSDIRIRHRTIDHHNNKPMTVKIHKKRVSNNSSDSHGLGNTSFMVAGSAALLASALAVSVTHPIDTLKTMKQAKQSGIVSSDTPITLSGLYRGISSNILKEAPNAAVYLATYELFKSALLTIPLFTTFPLAAMCLAGMLGDGVGSVVRVPAEIINKRLQLGLNDSWGSAIRDSFLSSNGVQSTLASWEAVLWRDVPYGGLQIAAYEFFRLSLANAGFVGLFYSVFAGAGAGLLAAVITTPADVLVTRMSTQSPQCYLETKHYMSPIATFRRIIKDEGFHALWTGAFHRGLFYMPMIGLFFAAYESFKHIISNPEMIRNIGFVLLGVVVNTLAPVVKSLIIMMSLGATTLKIPLVLMMLVVVYSFKKEHRQNQEWSQH